jgi:hypothetical protein
LKLTSDASKKMTIGNVRMGLKSWSGESLASSRSRISSRTIFFLLNFSPIYDFVDSSTLENSSNSVEKRTRFRNEINWSRPCDYCTDFGELPASQVKGQPDSRHHTEGSIFFYNQRGNEERTQVTVKASFGATTKMRHPIPSGWIIFSLAVKIKTSSSIAHKFDFVGGANFNRSFIM